MKKLLLIVSIIVFLPLHAKTYQLIEQKGLRSFEDVKVSSLSNKILVNFSVAQMDASSKVISIPMGQQFQQLKFKGLELTSETGLPSVPFYSVIVKGKPSQLKVAVDEGKSKLFRGFNPIPTPRQKKRCGEDCGREDFNIDWTKYYYGQKTAFYKVEYLGAFQGVDLSRVLLFPARYNGSDQTFEIFPEIGYEISSSTRAAMTYYENPSQIIKKEDRGARYLIISPVKFHRTLAEFIEWKEELGYQVDLVKLEDIGNNYTKIKDYIHNRYQNEDTRFTYALLVGDSKTLVTGYEQTDTSSYTPSDLHYFTMDGGNDFVPDVFYGRMVATTTAHIRNQVAKIMEYERGDFDNDPARFRQLGIASNEGYSPSDREYVQMMTGPLSDAYGTDVSYIFESGGGSYYDYVDPNTYFSRGVAWVNYIGHGAGTYWASLDRSYYSTYVKNISPGKMKPIIIDVACENGNFRYTGRMLGERFMNSTNSNRPVGAVAYYGASVETTWDPPAIMAIGIGKMIVNYNLTKLGQALLGGQIYLYKNHSSAREVRSNMRWYHLFGDPSLQIRLGDL